MGFKALVRLPSVVVFLVVLLRSIVFFSVVSDDFHRLFWRSLIPIPALFLAKRPDRYKAEHCHHQELSYELLHFQPVPPHAVCLRSGGRKRCANR